MADNAGLQGYDSRGICVLDMTNSLTRMLGQVDATTGTGEFVVDIPENQKVWAYGYCTAGEALLGVFVKGHTVSWIYRSAKSSGYSGVIYYGSY